MWVAINGVTEVTKVFIDAGVNLDLQVIVYKQC
jgi:hypothetical protein